MHRNSSGLVAMMLTSSAALFGMALDHMQRFQVLILTSTAADILGQ